jgi:hypothetical protein
MCLGGALSACAGIADSPLLSDAKQQLKPLLVSSRENEDFVLDVSFCSEEIERVLRNLKSGRSAGHDKLQPEHLKYGGAALNLWIKQVVNAIVEFESIPDSFKLGIVTPVYKGGGRDPLDNNSYRGITLSPLLAKVLESLLLEHLHCALTENELPHVNQTAYQKKVSCAEAIFSTLEVVSKSTQNNDRMYLCFCDLHLTLCNTQFFSSDCMRQASMGRPGDYYKTGMTTLRAGYE